MLQPEPSTLVLWSVFAVLGLGAWWRRGAYRPTGIESFQPLGRFIYYAAPNLYIQARQLFGGKTEEVWSRVMDAAKDQAGDAAEMAKEAAGRQLEESREKVEDAARDAVER